MMNSIINEIDYGPLAKLVGRWIGNRGLDDAPDANANSDKTAYTDELTFEVAGPAENAEEQQLVAVRYHHLVRKLENGKIFHDQIGHWTYEPSTQLITHSLSIPRAVCLLAGGQFRIEDGKDIYSVESKKGSESFGIAQSKFMLEKATTKAFKLEMIVCGNELSYHETTSLEIYGKSFEHTDKSVMYKVGYDQD